MTSLVLRDSIALAAATLAILLGASCASDRPTEGSDAPDATAPAAGTAAAPDGPPGEEPAAVRQARDHVPPEDPGLYPDLETLAPVALEFDQVEVEDELHWVLRFTNRILNAGEGPAEVRGEEAGDAEVVQRIYSTEGSYVDRIAGTVIFHPTHDHWHFDSLMAFELWERDAFERWIESGRTEGEPGWRQAKLSSCLLDSGFGEDLPGAPGGPIYDLQCLPDIQGISVGWIDIYDWLLPDQWVTLDTTPLPDGDYVLRTVADPDNRLHESPGGLDPSRESEEANEYIQFLTVRGFEITAS